MGQDGNLNHREKIGAFLFGLLLFGGLFFLIYNSIFHPATMYDDTPYMDGEEDLSDMGVDEGEAGGDMDEGAPLPEPETPPAPVKPAPAKKK